MTKSVLMTFAACAFALAPSLSHAAGSSPVAWVSKQFGANKSGCGPVTDPCQTFQYAHDNIVAPGGTINVRDAGGYGPLVIRNSISIINESGLVAGIFGAQGNAIDIQAGASDAILIKGLTLNGANASANGINVWRVDHRSKLHSHKLCQLWYKIRRCVGDNKFLFIQRNYKQHY